MMHPMTYGKEVAQLIASDEPGLLEQNPFEPGSYEHCGFERIRQLEMAKQGRPIDDTSIEDFPEQSYDDEASR